MASDYQTDVTDMATSLYDDAKARFEGGERDLREWFLDYLHESIDGCARVIYTAQAKECVCESRNSGAYAENYGAEGMTKDGDINWSALAYAAFEADVLEEIDGMGGTFDVNDDNLGFKEPEDADDEAQDATDGES